MKQTVEEAAKTYYEKVKVHLTKDLFRPRIIDIFKAGAKWQEGQSYTEDKIRQAILDYCDENGMDDEEAKECVDDFINNFLNKSGCSEKPNDQSE